MKKILLFAFLLCSFSALAQYPAQPTTKQELGRQTTGDGLIYRGSGAPAYTPSNNRNAWIYYDTTNNRLYKSRLGSWSLMVQDTSAFNEIQMPYIVDDTIYLTQNVTGEPLTRYVNRVWPITNLSDTTSITGENQGDVAIVASGDTVAFRGSAYWNPFSGGGGGGLFTSFNIAGDSGTPQTITDGNTATFEGGFGITTSTLLTDQLRVEIDSSQVLTASAFLTAYLALSADINTRVQGSGTANKYTRFLSTGSPASIGDGNMTHSATGPVVDANLAYRITGGTTASRPTGAAGMMYWNTSNTWWDYHNGTAWFNPARSATTNGLFTAGSVLFAHSDGTIQQDNANLFWDNTNKRFGIGTNAPASELEVYKSFNGVTSFSVNNPTNGTSARTAFAVSSVGTTGSNGISVQAFSKNYTSLPWGSAYLAGGVLFARYATNTTDAGRFAIANVSEGNGAKQISFHIQASSILSDASKLAEFTIDKFEVNSKSGDFDFQVQSDGDAANIWSDGALNAVGIGTNAPDRKLHSELSDAVTNAMTFPLRLTHITSGTAAAGSGAGIEFEAESAGGTNRVAGTIENPFTTATNAAEVSDLVFRTMRAGTLTESLRSLGNGTLQIGTLSGTASKIGAFTSGNIATVVTPTITTAGTTGDRTINELAGTVNIAAAGTTVTVTNSLVTANSLVFCTLRTNDTTATVKNVVPIAGSFTINLGAAATGEVSIGFFVVN